MADEIQNANVIRITRDGDRWLAVIGPDPQRGLVGSGPNPASALLALVGRCIAFRWPFDETWQPGKTSLHDA